MISDTLRRPCPTLNSKKRLCQCGQALAYVKRGRVSSPADRPATNTATRRLPELRLRPPRHARPVPGMRGGAGGGDAGDHAAAALARVTPAGRRRFGRPGPGQRGADNVMPISGRAGTAPALEPQEAYPPARSTALAGYAAAESRPYASGEVRHGTGETGDGREQVNEYDTAESHDDGSSAHTGAVPN